MSGVLMGTILTNLSLGSFSLTIALSVLSLFSSPLWYLQFFLTKQGLEFKNIDIDFPLSQPRLLPDLTVYIMSNTAGVL